MEGEMIEEVAKKGAKLRWFELSSNEGMEGDYCLEFSFDSKLDFDFIRNLKTSLPYKKYENLYISAFEDATILEFTGVEKYEDS